MNSVSTHLTGVVVLLSALQLRAQADGDIWCDTWQQPLGHYSCAQRGRPSVTLEYERSWHCAANAPNRFKSRFCESKFDLDMCRKACIVHGKNGCCQYNALDAIISNNGCKLYDSDSNYGGYTGNTANFGLSCKAIDCSRGNTYKDNVCQTYRDYGWFDRSPLVKYEGCPVTSGVCKDTTTATATSTTTNTETVTATTTTTTATRTKTTTATTQTRTATTATLTTATSVTATSTTITLTVSRTTQTATTATATTATATTATATLTRTTTTTATATLTTTATATMTLTTTTTATTTLTTTTTVTVTLGGEIFEIPFENELMFKEGYDLILTFLNAKCHSERDLVEYFEEGRARLRFKDGQEQVLGGDAVNETSWPAKMILRLDQVDKCGDSNFTTTPPSSGTVILRGIESTVFAVFFGVVTSIGNLFQV